MRRARILRGDALGCLRKLPSESVHCCVTSPPYWGLRDYSTEPYPWPAVAYSPMPGLPEIEVPDWIGELGAEPSPELYVAHLVTVFREVRRVLRGDGTLWLNLGDSYSGARGGVQGEGGQLADRSIAAASSRVRNRTREGEGLKGKDLGGIPWRAAFALQADGWTLRSDVIWAKPNPMPESVRDRPTKSHEYLFLLTKGERYFWDQEAVREECESERERGRPDGAATYESFGVNSSCGTNGAGRNIRSVWAIATRPFPGAHFAVFPSDLPERCIKAGTPERGCCPGCGAPWRQLVERYRTRDGERVDGLGAWRGTDQREPSSAQGDGHWRYEARTKKIGWRPGCNCPALEGERPREPCTVLDPFCGAGTTGLAALRLGRGFTGVELSERSCQLARDRIWGDAPLLNEVTVEEMKP